MMSNGSHGKSFTASKQANPLLRYALDHTHKHPAQLELQAETLTRAKSVMLGSMEVLSLNTAFVKSRRAGKCLDIGTYTGASALSMALGLDQNNKGSEVITMDFSDEHIDLAKKYWIAANVENLIKFVKGPASDTLQDLIDQGHAGTFDFAFIDADKPGYKDYYEKCLVLMKTGGVIALDNTFYDGSVLREDCLHENAIAIKQLNEFLIKDTERVFVLQLPIGDGYTIVVKL